MEIANNITSLVGNTPLVKLERIRRHFNCHPEIIAKLESFNPSASVKDRIAYAMLSNAEEEGLIKSGKTTLIEATSQWENVEDDPQYFSGVAFGDLADNANATITKGMRVVIVGKLNYSSWQDQEGNNRSKVQIVIDEISPSLRFASATVNRQELNSEPVARETYEEDEAPF